MKVAALAFLAVLAIGCLAEAQETPSPTSSKNAATPATSARPLARVFTSVLPELKAKTDIPVFLPGKLPKPIGNAEHALVKAAEKEYSISLYYELDVGDAGFATEFGAEAEPKYQPQELGNTQEVKLAHGIRGFFRPVSCGASCAPANLWWVEAGVLYQVQLVMSSRTSEADQEKSITAVSNSSILAGPR
jgi:hypothetical protein